MGRQIKRSGIFCLWTITAALGFTASGCRTTDGETGVFDWRTRPETTVHWFTGVNRHDGVNHEDDLVVLTHLTPKPKKADDPRDARQAKEQTADANAVGSTAGYRIRSIIEGWIYLIGTAPGTYTDVIDATATGSNVAVFWGDGIQYVFFLDTDSSNKEQVHVELRSRPGLTKGPTTQASLDPQQYVTITRQLPDTWTVGTPTKITNTGPADIPDADVKKILKKIYLSAKQKGLNWPLNKVDPQ